MPWIDQNGKVENEIRLKLQRGKLLRILHVEMAKAMARNEPHIPRICLTSRHNGAASNRAASIVGRYVQLHHGIDSDFKHGKSYPLSALGGLPNASVK